MTYSTSAIGMKRPANNYSNCPLKKRPIKYDWNIVDNSSSSDSENTNSDFDNNMEPENLSTKPEDLRIISTSTSTFVPKKGSPIFMSPSSINSSSALLASSNHQQFLPNALNLIDITSNSYSSSSAAFLPSERRSPISHFASDLPRSNQHQHQQQSLLKPLYSQIHPNYYSNEYNIQDYTPINQQQQFLPFYKVNRSCSLSSEESSSDRSSPTLLDSLSPRSCGSSSSSSTSLSAASSIAPTNVNGRIRYQCPDCTKSYSTFSGLSKHLQFHCSSQHTKSFSCKYCEKVYTSIGALKMHIRTHTLPCKCTICGKAFSRPWLLQGHIRTHTGEKPFSCEYCHRAFADRSNLRAHLQTHSEVKKYSCQLCSKTFSRTSLLAKHQETGCCRY